jgi:hypothetical protein
LTLISSVSAGAEEKQLAEIQFLTRLYSSIPRVRVLVQTLPLSPNNSKTWS